jgi:hypothetical protein
MAKTQQGVICNGKQKIEQKQTRKTGTQRWPDSLSVGFYHLLTLNRNRDDSNRHRILNPQHRRWYNPLTRRNPGRVSFRNLRFSDICRIEAYHGNPDLIKE